MNAFFGNPLFGICITLGAYAIGKIIYDKVRLSLLHPVISASAIIIAVLLCFDISPEDYQQGGSMISFLLGPATVSLAVPLYNRINVLKKHAVIILISITAGSAASVVSAILVAQALGLPDELILSMVPKSITTPIAVEASAEIGGLPSVTALAVIITGIMGAVFGPFLLGITGIKHPVARGLAMGTSSHAIGTSRALEMGETEGALSGLSIGLAGIITVIAAPFLVQLLMTS